MTELLDLSLRGLSSICPNHDPPKRPNRPIHPSFFPIHRDNINFLGPQHQRPPGNPRGGELPNRGTAWASGQTRNSQKPFGFRKSVSGNRLPETGFRKPVSGNGFPETFVNLSVLTKHMFFVNFRPIRRNLLNVFLL